MNLGYHRMNLGYHRMNLGYHRMNLGYPRKAQKTLLTIEKSAHTRRVLKNYFVVIDYQLIIN